jgi:hypothetical protein
MHNVDAGLLYRAHVEGVGVEELYDQNACSRDKLVLVRTFPISRQIGT